ncbi:immunoglobulin lambda-1 light chain-like [Mugil cephalus]|uniref:immunoglobulin lambda-1 light chain-like n=1 Tax=Mugil cephalus TaxID=48193 RepID=UPI001FB5C8B2|nr:immunoglobulin lambda-1 light chain-like [Mugil cephalus]
MLFLPAAALCCLCSALVAMAADLTQDQLTWTRRVGQTVSFRFEGTGQCDDDNVLWLQKKETETFKLILIIDKSDGRIGRIFNHPQENDFSAVCIQNVCKLEIKKVKVNHSASYYCSCGKRVTRYFIFVSGTKLIVTDEQVVKPVVSVYPAASRPNQEGKSSLLCLASSMFPPVVQFSWKRQKKGGSLEDLTSAQGDQLELRESGHRASIRLVDRDDLYTYKYICSVKHEGGVVDDTLEERVEDRVEAQALQGVPAPAASCPPEREPADLAALQQHHCKITCCFSAWTAPMSNEDTRTTLQDQSDTCTNSYLCVCVCLSVSFQSQCRVKLLCLLYTVLIVKSLVYCCGLSLLMTFVLGSD